MADNQKQFQDFLTEIQLVGEELTSLRTSREANRNRITKYWKETLKRNAPTFEEQGSFEMGTVIDPITGDYDLDDGMYLNCIDDNPADWPTTETIQNWVANAVEGATREDPKRMKRCVRVPYQGGYHIDIPAYGKDEEGKTRVFKKATPATEFEESNPVDLVDWFAKKKKLYPSLRDLVRFFKAWRDFQKGDLLKVKSVAMTILIANKIVEAATYGESVVKTARACEAHLRYNGTIQKPVAPFEDLTSSWSADERTAIADAFKTLADRGDDAIAAETVRDGALIWQRQYGLRYPVPEEEKGSSGSNAMRTAAPAITGSGSFA